MRRALAVCLLFALAAAAFSGCGARGTSATVPTVVRAPPQSAHLGWEEPYPATKPALVFGVSSFTVTHEGWSAAISVENRSGVPWRVGDAASRAFGVLLFPNDDLDELERRNRSGALPAIRQATRFEPALPVELAPGTTWRGTISAPGALAGGLWVRISFGPFVTDDPPDGTGSPVIWFTDHAYQLDEVAGEPA